MQHDAELRAASIQSKPAVYASRASGTSSVDVLVMALGSSCTAQQGMAVSTLRTEAGCCTDPGQVWPPSKAGPGTGHRATVTGMQASVRLCTLANRYTVSVGWLNPLSPHLHQRFLLVPTEQLPQGVGRCNKPLQRPGVLRHQGIVAAVCRGGEAGQVSEASGRVLNRCIASWADEWDARR